MSLLPDLPRINTWAEYLQSKIILERL
jgi:hypothetical protein